MRPEQQKVQDLIRLLQRPSASADLCRALGISQPTFSRLWPMVPGVLALGAARSRKYAMLRPVPGVAAPLPISRIAADGHIALVGMLHILHGGWYALTDPARSNYRLYLGLPFFLKDLRPQGFLGRQEPLRHPDLALPQDILRWSDDQVLHYLSCRSEHAAGNLILGNESQVRHLESVQQTQTVAAASRVDRYPLLAHAAMQGDVPGSSAAGEQPKFTCVIQRGLPPTPAEHVIVKFSPPVSSPSGRRWADLLVCEHLALETLAAAGLPAARTQVLQYGERVFLEIARFDRLGCHGRLPMVTFSALDGDLGMLDQSWSAVAQALHARRSLSPGDVDIVEIFDLYGALIGNVDKHHGNIAVAWDFDQPYRLLPAYDMLPMLYRPNAHGEILSREWSSLSLRRMPLRHLSTCLPMARTFWQQVVDDPRISHGFKDIAARHQAAIRIANPLGAS